MLRHRPDSVGLVLDEAGWADVDGVLAALAAHGVRVSRAQLEDTVRTDGKQRFALDPSGTRVRAQQGHSVPVELGYPVRTPPAVLWHGTPERNVPAVLAEGLHRGGRHAVHLSADPETARAVGQRRGSAVVLRVDAAGLSRDGAVFTRSGNGVWLVAAVPARYLRVE